MGYKYSVRVDILRHEGEIGYILVLGRSRHVAAGYESGTAL